MVIPVFDLHLRFTHGSLKCFMGLEYENIHLLYIFLQPVSWRKIFQSRASGGFFYPINLISLNWNFPNLSSRLRITPPPLRVAPLDSSKGRGDFLKDLGIANGQPFETLGITDYIFGRKNKVFKPLISWSQMAGVGFIHQDLAYSTWKMRIPKPEP